MIPRAYIGLGGNVGDRMAYLQAAVAALSSRLQIHAISRVYETAPVGFTAQGPFLNAVVEASGIADAEKLLRCLQDLETSLGRRPRFRNGPREIDLDLLLLGDCRRTAAPRLPHPRMHERAFVLQPLLDIAPDIRLPGLGDAARFLADIPDQELAHWPRDLDWC